MKTYQTASLSADVAAFRKGHVDSSLRIDISDDFATYYSPFDHVNSNARIAIIGITPGRAQAANALAELQRAYTVTGDWSKSLEAAKVHASFSGPMRSNLVRLMDFVGLQRLVGISSSAELFEQRADLAHFTSAIRYPVFLHGKDYGGSPPIMKTPWLLKLAEKWLVEEIRMLPDAVFIPLGPKVGDVLFHLSRIGLIAPERIIAGLPHPSGANAERISYFLNRKPRDQLSLRTNAGKIDTARSGIQRQMAMLLA